MPPAPTLAARLALPAIRAAVEPACLPPHNGRICRHALLAQGCASHRIEAFDAPDIRHPADSGGTPCYRLFRAIPQQAAPRGGWPVLYMLDGNAAFDFLDPVLLARAPDLVVIGMGYATDAQFARSARGRDYTYPAPAQGALAPDPTYGNRLTGGAPDFAPLLTGPLRARAEHDLPVDPARRSLWGHSFAGLFALSLMLRAPDSFARYAIISPSLWWYPERLAPWLDRIPATPIYLAVGDREQRTGDQSPARRGPPQAFTDLINHLAQQPHVDLSHQIYAGARHIASLPTSLAPTLEFARR